MSVLFLFRFGWPQALSTILPCTSISLILLLLISCYGITLQQEIGGSLFDTFMNLPSESSVTAKTSRYSDSFHHSIRSLFLYRLAYWWCKVITCQSCSLLERNALQSLQPPIHFLPTAL